MRSQRSNHVRRNRFPAPYRVHAFIRLRLEVNFLGRHAQRAGQRFAHLEKMRTELGFFRDHHGVDVLDREILFGQQLFCMLQKNQAVRAFPFRIRVRKMREALAKALGVGVEKVHLKAKSNEGVDAIGRGEAIAAHVVATLVCR